MTPDSAAGPSKGIHDPAGKNENQNFPSYFPLSWPDSSKKSDPSIAVANVSANPSHPQYYVSSNTGNVWPYSQSVPQYSSPSVIQQPYLSQHQHHNPQAAPTNPISNTILNLDPTAPRSPSPPPPVFRPHWDAALKSFLVRLGLTQALRGFELDMVIMNTDWERSNVPGAVDDLIQDLLKLGESKEDNQGSELVQRSLEDRKVDYIHLASGAKPQSQTSLNKAISRFLAQNRARNDASNRAEFLHSSAPKRRRIDEDAGDSSVSGQWSCARTDAKPIDRDIQMKYDIAKNEDGPLRRTVKSHTEIDKSQVQTKGQNHRDIEKGKQKMVLHEDDDEMTADRHPGLHERLTNIETHLSVRYVPSPPRTLMSRLKFLEDHIVRLEKDYPPWAALHFNQPKRGWPPPPRPMPIIVPPNLRGASGEVVVSADVHSGLTSNVAPPPTQTSASASGNRKTNMSSLQRAVMEKLEVKKAMDDLAGEKT